MWIAHDQAWEEPGLAIASGAAPVGRALIDLITVFDRVCSEAIASGALCTTKQRTAVREVFEETGIDAAAAGHALRDWGLENVYEIYPQWQHRYAPGVTHNVEHVFGLCVPRAEPVRLSPREHRDQAWLPWRDAVERCFSPSNAEAIAWLPRLGGMAGR